MNRLVEVTRHATGLRFYRYEDDTRAWEFFYAVGEKGAVQLLEMKLARGLVQERGIGLSPGFGYDGGVHRRVEQGEACPIPELDGYCDFNPNGNLGYELGARVEQGEDVWRVLADAYRGIFDR